MVSITHLVEIISAIFLAAFISGKIHRLNVYLAKFYRTELAERRCAEWTAFRLNIEAFLKKLDAERDTGETEEEDEDDSDLFEIIQHAQSESDIHCEEGVTKYEAYLQNATKASKNSADSNFWIRPRKEE